MALLADLYRRKLHLPNAIFTYINHEDAMVAAVFKPLASFAFLVSHIATGRPKWQHRTINAMIFTEK